MKNCNTYKKYYQTKYGTVLLGECEKILSLKVSPIETAKVNLIFTSPPFPLNRAKRYGNMTGKEYLNWISKLGPLFKKILAPDGSIVIELGNAWDKGAPTHSTLPIESLLELKNSGEFNLCQEFIYYNPARLPSPIEWVNKKRIRVKDSFTRFWWLSSTPYPKANNLNIVEEYSKQMKKLIKSGKYNSGSRPSEHSIGKSSFAKDNGGAIPSNVLIASNTISNDQYTKYCKNKGLTIHPARMPTEVVEFFIKFLTDENDLVLDPFSGSNTTGSIAEKLHRKWISIEASEEYIKGSLGRFTNIILQKGVRV
jgi:site-specific DNA-methyltransferase (cytosine-N4-specific)